MRDMQEFYNNIALGEKGCFIATGSPDRAANSRSELRHKHNIIIILNISQIYTQNMCKYVYIRYIICQVYVIHIPLCRYKYVTHIEV
jgi:hypothetical protein